MMGHKEEEEIEKKKRTGGDVNVIKASVEKRSEE